MKKAINIDEILEGYLEAALWTEEENLTEENEDLDVNIFNIASGSVEQAKKDIETFIANAGEDAINEAVEKNGLSHLGHDILLTRNRHGAGFFDHCYNNEKKMMDAAQCLGEKYIYCGDDGKIYID